MWTDASSTQGRVFIIIFSGNELNKLNKYVRKNLRNLKRWTENSPIVKKLIKFCYLYSFICNHLSLSHLSYCLPVLLTFYFVLVALPFLTFPTRDFSDSSRSNWIGQRLMIRNSQQFSSSRGPLNIENDRRTIEPRPRSRGRLLLDPID